MRVLYYYDSDTDTTVPVSVEKSQIEDEKELEFIYDETVRKAWDAKNEEWYFSIVDTCQVLTEQLLRIIQAIPSPKAEPFKQWLAQVGAERLEEIADPEKAMNRAVSYYQRKD